MPSRSILDRLADPAPLLLDGATGTELNRRGVDTSLPLWSAAAIESSPGVLARIHADYAAAGAEVVTANTFRTHERNLRAGGIHGRAADWTARAVEIAREAAPQAWIAGSQAPLEDCYSPQLTPDDDALRAEHVQMAANLAAAGVDLILIETQPTIREAMAAARAAASTGLPFMVSFVCGNFVCGGDGRLLSSESLAAAAEAVLAFHPCALLVNCAPARIIEPLLCELRSACGELPIGGYANVGEADPIQGWRNTDADDPVRYAAYASTWLAAGARLIGGCCGTTPEHVRMLRQSLGYHAVTA